MIDGITVLSKTGVSTASVPLVLMATIGGFVITFILFALLTQKIDVDENFMFAVAMIMSLGVAVLAGVAVYSVTLEPTGRCRYECLIDESVSAVELNERYVIKEKRGEIYVIEDKEGEDGNV